MRRSPATALRTTSLAAGITALVLGQAASALAAPPPAPYANGLEVDQATLSADERFAGLTRVPAGDVPASEGTWVGRTGPVHFQNPTAVISRLGGYSTTFPTGGWDVEVDVWLAPSMSPLGADLHLDWSAAAASTTLNNRGDVGHRRDFVLNLGTDGLGGFVASASNNVSNTPEDPTRNPAFFSAPADGGWFTIRHAFRDDGTGVLAVTIELLDPAGAPVGAWTLSDPTDVIGETVGGSRYAWLVTNDFGALHLDDLQRDPADEPPPVDDEDSVDDESEDSASDDSSASEDSASEDSADDEAGDAKAAKSKRAAKRSKG